MDCTTHFECQEQQKHLYCDLAYSRCESCHLVCQNNANVDCRTNCQHFLRYKENELSTTPVKTPIPSLVTTSSTDTVKDNISSQGLVLALQCTIFLLIIVFTVYVFTFIIFCIKNRMKADQLQNRKSPSENAQEISEIPFSQPLLLKEKGSMGQNPEYPLNEVEDNQASNTEARPRSSNNNNTSHWCDLEECSPRQPPGCHQKTVQISQNTQHQEKAQDNATLHQNGNSNEQYTDQIGNTATLQQQSPKTANHSVIFQNKGDNHCLATVKNGKSSKPLIKNNSMNSFKETTFIQEEVSKTDKPVGPDGKMPTEQKQQNVETTDATNGATTDATTIEGNNQDMNKSREAGRKNVTSYGSETTVQNNFVDEGYGPSPESTPHSSDGGYTAGNDLFVDTHSDTGANAQARVEKVTKPAFVNRKFIYDYLRKAPWVDGYFSAGDSIEVYVDLTTITEAWALDELTKQTHQQPNIFHIKHTTEQF